MSCSVHIALEQDAALDFFKRLPRDTSTTRGSDQALPLGDFFLCAGLILRMHYLEHGPAIPQPLFVVFDDTLQERARSLLWTFLLSLRIFPAHGKLLELSTTHRSQQRYQEVEVLLLSPS